MLYCAYITGLAKVLPKTILPKTILHVNPTNEQKQRADAELTSFKIRKYYFVSVLKANVTLKRALGHSCERIKLNSLNHHAVSKITLQHHPRKCHRIFCTGKKHFSYFLSMHEICSCSPSHYVLKELTHIVSKYNLFP